MKETRQTGTGSARPTAMSRTRPVVMRRRGFAGRGWCQAMVQLCLVSVTGLGVPAQTKAAGFEPREAAVMVDSMMADGRLSLTQFEWQGSVEDTLASLERQWSTADIPPMRSTRDDWQVITRLDGEVVESVELRQRAAGLVEGRRIRWRADAEAVKALREDERWFRALLPARAAIQPPIRHEDGGRLNTTLVAVSDSPMRRLDTWIERQLQRQGYQKLALDFEPGADEVAAEIGESGRGASPSSGPLTRSSSERGPKALAGKGARASTELNTRSGRRLKPMQHPAEQAMFYTRGSEEIFLTVSQQSGGQTVVLHWRR